MKRLGGPLMIVGSMLVCAGAAAPWLRIGQVERSAFSLARHARELGVLDRTALRASVYALFLVPPAVGVLVALVSIGARRLAATLGGCIACIGILAGAAGLRFEATTSTGPVMTLAGGLAGAVGSVLWLRHRHRSVL